MTADDMWTLACLAVYWGLLGVFAVAFFLMWWD